MSNNKATAIKEHAKKLRLTNLKNNLETILEEAEQEQPSYLGFLDQVLSSEVGYRAETAMNRRRKQACFPEDKTLDEFKLDHLKGLTQRNFNSLVDCGWIEKKFNLIMIGPPGIGKTHLAIALGSEAVRKGYAVSFVTVKELLELLVNPDLNIRSKARAQRLYSSQLIIIDEVGYYPFNPVESGHFFHFLNELHNKASFLITSNKSFDKWPEFLGDEDLVLAALDRLLFHCDVLKLNGSSYRLENRQTLLE